VSGSVSYFFSPAGFLQFNGSEQQGAPGLPGSIGFGGGGGGPSNVLIGTSGGGGQGGGRGLGGLGGAAGGDSVGLVLLGTQLPPACAQAPSLTACGLSVTVSAGQAGNGGLGGLGGNGGNGGAGASGGVLPGGGSGGKGCAGGGGAGGRGGVALGVASDLDSLGTNVLPTWLTASVATNVAVGGSGADAGFDGLLGGNYTCGGPTVIGGASGLPGVRFTSVVLPMRTCSDFRSVDSDFAPSAQWVMGADGGASTVASANCP
jgi:hypothetical protein